MYTRTRCYIIFTLLSVCSFTVLPEGFAPDTWVRLGKKVGWQTIAKTVVFSKKCIFKDPVLSCNVRSGRWQAKKVRKGATVDTNCYIKLWFDGCTECDIACAPDQKFYSVTAKRWVQAYQLIVGEYLLAEGNNRVKVSDIALVQEPIRMYIINVKHNETFVVGRHRVLTHNMAIASDLPAEIVGSVVASVTSVIGLAVEGGSIVLGGALAGPVGLVAVAGLGYIAGSFLADACKMGGSCAQYRTKFCAEKIDGTIARMKEGIAGQTLRKQRAVSDAAILQCAAPSKEDELEKKGYGCGTGQNIPQEIPIPGPCVSGISDNRGEHPDKKFYPEQKPDDVLQGLGCGTKVGQDIELRPCGFSSRGWAAIVEDILKQLPKVDGKAQGPCEECTGLEKDADAAEKEAENVRARDNESQQETSSEIKERGVSELDSVIGDEVRIGDQSQLADEGESLVIDIDLAAVDHAESKQSFVLDKEYVKTVSEADAELKVIVEKVKQYWKQKQKNVCKEHGKRSAKGEHAYKPKELEELILSPQEIEKLVKVFDGTLAVPVEIGEGVHVWIDYDHILNPMLKIGCKDHVITPAGFHHDYLGELQKSGLIESTIIQQGEHGVYEIKWSYIGGQKKTSTLFPDHWTETQVIEKIGEAIRDANRDVKSTRNRFQVEGLTTEGIKIRIIMERYELQNGMNIAKIVTAHPLIEREHHEDIPR